MYKGLVISIGKERGEGSCIAQVCRHSHVTIGRPEHAHAHTHTHFHGSVPSSPESLQWPETVLGARGAKLKKLTLYGGDGTSPLFHHRVVEFKIVMCAGW